MNEPSSKALPTKVIQTQDLRTSDGTEDPIYNEFEMAYVYCEDDETGYCLSLSRCRSQELVGVMVLDQKCYNTRDLTVILSRDELRVQLSPAVADALDGIADYQVPLAITNKQFVALAAALSVLFQGGGRGTYDRLL